MLYPVYSAGCFYTLYILGLKNILCILFGGVFSVCIFLGCFLDGPRLGSHDLLTVIELARRRARAGISVAAGDLRCFAVPLPGYHGGRVDHDWLRRRRARVYEARNFTLHGDERAVQVFLGAEAVVDGAPEGVGDLDGLGDLDGAGLAGNLIGAALLLLGASHVRLVRVRVADMFIDAVAGEQKLTVRANEISDDARLLTLVVQILVDVDDGGSHDCLLACLLISDSLSDTLTPGWTADLISIFCL